MKKIIADNLSFLQAVGIAEEKDMISCPEWSEYAYYFKAGIQLKMSEMMEPPLTAEFSENNWRVRREVEEPVLMTDDEIFEKAEIDTWRSKKNIKSAIKFSRKQGRMEFKPFIALVLEYFGDSQRTGKENTELFLKIKEMIPNLPKFD